MSTKMHIANFEEPRSSSETEQRYLLAESICPSESASAITDVYGDGDRTPRARSPTREAETTVATGHRHQSIAAPEQAHTQGQYHGFKSEQAYLDALRSWAESRRYTTPSETSIIGFYGTTSMDEYASRPPALQPLGIRKKWKSLKASRQEQKVKKLDERRATIA